MKIYKHIILVRTVALPVTLALLTAILITPAPAYGDRAIIELVPQKGPVGTKVIVILTNFTPGTVDISFDTEVNIVESVSSNDDGNAYTYFITEDYPAGEYKVWAIDDDNKEYNVFTITPEIEIDVTSAQVDAEIVATGTGFAAESEISITFDGEEYAISKTNEDGVFSGAKFTIPQSSHGKHTIRALDDDKNYAESTFSTEQSITVSASQGGVGTGVTISGTGFASDSDVTITFADTEVAITETDEYGSFSDTFIVPPMVQGSYRITISDGSNSSYADFSVLSGTTLNPTQGNVGSELTVSGSGFTANSDVTIRYSNSKVSTAKTDASGNFEAVFKVPESKHGEHALTISDKITTSELTFTMETEPPPVPKLLSPESGTKVPETPTLSWETVTDPSGVTYTLQIAADENFSHLVQDRSGLTAPDFTVPLEESLLPVKQETPYYWRVKATDRAQNAGDWSAKGSFYTGVSIATPPGWIQWGLTGLGITLFGFLFGTFLQRLRRMVLGD